MHKLLDINFVLKEIRVPDLDRVRLRKSMKSRSLVRSFSGDMERART